MKSNQHLPPPSLIVLGYVGLLVATVAALLAWPFSQPLAWLMCLLLGVFFLFAFSVILLAVSIFVGSIWMRFSGSTGELQKLWFQDKRRIASSDADMWDGWIDGA